MNDGLIGLKKIVPLFLAISLILFSGCKVKNYTPELPVDFNLSAAVTSGDFSFDCEICKNNGSVRVDVLTTSAQGLSMNCDGKSLTFVYDGCSYAVNASDFEKTNCAIVVYEVFDYLNSAERINVKKIEGGYKYEGKISIGDFILIQNDDNSLKEITMKASQYSIKFK